MTSSVLLHPPPLSRADVGGLLRADKLSSKLHFMYDNLERQMILEKKKPKKKSKSKGNEKSRVKREKSPEKVEPEQPVIELSGNASSFSVYSTVRQVVLEGQTKKVSEVYAQLHQGSRATSDSEDEDDKSKDALLKLPKIVSLGLCGVFELIRETRTSLPELCTRTLQALLDMLQGQQPEGLKSEPADVIDSLYELLMELCMSPVETTADRESLTLPALACSCLLSLVVARGDTGKILTAIASLLMSPTNLATQQIKTPGILTSLQKSVHSILLGRTVTPDWLNKGIPDNSKMDAMSISELALLPEKGHCSIASDGRYLYIHNVQGLHKVGTGFGETIKAHVYNTNPDFYNEEDGWLAYANDMLFFKPYSERKNRLFVVNREKLHSENTYELEGESFGPNVMFTDGENIGHIAASKDESFVIRTFSPICEQMPLVNELPLKLARKCLDVFGLSWFDPESKIHSISLGIEEEVASIMSGKDFALVRTPNGKILYTGRSQSLGIKQGGPAPGKWAELPIVKSPKIVQYSVGHEAPHALLVAEDGSVFFVGTSKRGEDGDGSLSKARRQPKPLKPKKMIKMDGKFIVNSACNSGTSALVTKEGELYMFGKDKTYSDQGTGLVSELKDVQIAAVALGKAHTVILTKQGQIYTFGINNKGQCGRDYVAGASREISTPVTMADDEDEPEDEIYCAIGKHKWVVDKCMICTMCCECTGYGSSCISNDRPRPDWEVGISDQSKQLKSKQRISRPCGCGSGDSGCAACGICRSCAGVDKDVDPSAGDGPNQILMEVLSRNASDGSLDVLLAHQGSSSLDRKLDDKHRNEARSSHKEKHKVQGVSDASAPDTDQDHVKITSLPPACIQLGNGDTPVTQICCGQQHTVALLSNGEVYTFGSNQYGQLGQGDLNPRSSPCKVYLKSPIVQVTAGSYHTVLLTASGQVFTFGSYQKGQLGRASPIVPVDEKIKEKKIAWYATPGLVPNIGVKHGRRACWIGASGDQTFLRIDELLINTNTLSKSTIVANFNCIGLIATQDHCVNNMNSLIISRLDGTCRSFSEQNQALLAGQAVCLDPVYDVLWSYEPSAQMVACYSVIHSEARHLKTINENYCDILSPELAVPSRMNTLSTRSHCAIFLLGCLDTLTTAQLLGLSVKEEEQEEQTAAKTYTKEDFSVVNRFESHGGGWGYSGHSIEAIRFQADADILLGGFGLFGGRGDYFGKIKLLELGPDGGENEACGETLAESEEIPYECAARDKYPMLFPEPVLLQANQWYVAWARISGPSSDCGSSGQSSVTNDDQVMFKFKNSKKSNNGTDVNAGQIPQILYRLPSHDIAATIRKSETVEPAHVLSRQFSLSMTPDCFEALLKLLTWSWHTFCRLLAEVSSLKGSSPSVAQLDLDRLVYITTATLRLIKIYICEVYPVHGASSRTPAETNKIAEAIGEHRLLLRKILSDSRLHSMTNNHKRHGNERDGNLVYEKMANRILEECDETFISCFHAFYPTGALKWNCLCELLNILEPAQTSIEGYSRLLAAVMEALCHPAIKLTLIMPINCEYGTEQLLKQQFSREDNTSSTVNTGDVSPFPLLTTHMMLRSKSDSVMSVSGTQVTFREVLDKLLMLVVLPVRQLLNEEKQTLPAALVRNTCSLLSALMSELTASATGSEIDMSGTSRPLLTTPNRFTRTSQSAYWNTGNGSPDAVCFSVDRTGIVIAGVCVYGGGGQYEYTLELLDDSENGSESSHTGRWSVIESVRGNYSTEDCLHDVAEIKFDRPVPIKENVKYAISLQNRGFCTLNGDGGLSRVKCPDGTVFMFSACPLSLNGTSHARGQLPQILYYSAPQEGENSLQSSKALAQYQARKNAISTTSAIFRASSDLLKRAQGTHMECLAELLGQSEMFSTLLPMTVAYVGPVATMDPRAAVHILNLVQEILPAVADLNCQLFPPSILQSPTALVNGCTDMADSTTTSQHYAVVQSDHPYKPATVSNYKVTFPRHVKWMVLEFDPQCGTAQIEDTLQLYIPAKSFDLAERWIDCKTSEEEADCSPRWPVCQKFSTRSNWPVLGLILPGNEVEFSLETASDYVKDDKACFYGFKCTVIGYEWSNRPDEGLPLLEKEIGFLGGTCANSLMKKNIVLPVASVDETEEDIEIAEEQAQHIFNMHSNLLGKGFALAHAPSINQALEGNLPFSWSSNERAFLKDFIQCVKGTSGGRLAAWLQPESYLDPKHCEIQCNRDNLQCSWPSVITVLTKDQYARPVHVPNLKIEVKAVPILKEVTEEERKAKRLSRCDGDSGLTFGGLPAPKLDTTYSVTIKDRKDAYHAICMMKAYENYSFEELRFAAPVIRRPSENMLVQSNEDGTFSATWTPNSTGWYKIQVLFDGYEAGEPLKVKVREPTNGATPPVDPRPKRTTHESNKMRRFVGTHSGGLRIRVNPSLQSEQIGIIKPNGVLSFIDEIHNNDGVWLRLSRDSIQDFCGGNTNDFMEAWALQYNQHLGKTLLVPVDQPKSILNEIIKDARTKKITAQKKQRIGGPGVYQVVKCGSSGHNIRSRANLKATPVGMMVIGNQLTAEEEIVNCDGTWVKLDRDSVLRYCTEVEGEAWSLACGNDNTAYLQHESELRSEEDGAGALEFGAASGTSVKGFDFTLAQQTPLFSAFGAASQGFGGGASGVLDQPSTSSNPARFSTFTHSSRNNTAIDSNIYGNVPSFGQPGTRSLDRNLEGPSRLNALNTPLSGTSLRAISPHRNIPMPAPRVPERYESLLSDLPAELQGVSVKDLIKALGESRVNGNGVTPPRTPPGTPKKTPSRSSSPRNGGFHDSGLRLGPSSLQNQRSGMSSASSSPAHTPPCTPPTSRRMSAGAAATPPHTPPLLRTDYISLMDSPKLSDRRSQSVSPQRSERAMITRLSSMSPSRLHTSDKSRSQSPGGTAECHSQSPGGGLEIRSHSPGGNTEGLKGHFSIGAPPPKEDSRMSPKNSRKDRSKVLRGHRERGSPPTHSRDTPDRPRHGLLPGQKVLQAMSPSVAQCTRAVFAAFMWHEGIVHDAMACASFLKFHPDLPKELPKFSKTGSIERSGKGTPSGSLQRKGKSISLKDMPNININEAVKRLDQISMNRAPSGDEKVVNGHPSTETRKAKDIQVRPKQRDEQSLQRERALTTGALGKERHYSESKASDLDTSTLHDPVADSSTRNQEDKESKVPPTMKYLVYFWQEIASATQQIITKNLIVSPPGINTLRKAEKKEREKEKDKKNKKKKVDNKVPPAVRGNLFGEAAAAVMFGQARQQQLVFPQGAVVVGGPGPPDKETKCELCGGMFSHPVTYHMKEAHPGCGRHAKGQGYNSGGNYCPGWAGNCGDGGKGGSTWYLMCEQCREKYIREKQHLNKDKAKKSKKKTTPVKQAASSQALEPHMVMKNNAMFLLDLASAAGINMPTSTDKTGQRSPVKSQSGILPSVTEDFLEHSPFPATPFLYLAQHGAQGADSAFADDLVFDDGYYTNKPRPKCLSQSSQFEHCPNGERGRPYRRLHRSGSVTAENGQEILETLEEKSRSAEVSPVDAPSPTSSKTVFFQRSVSETIKRHGDDEDFDDDNDDDDLNEHHPNRRLMSGRRRNNSGGMADGGMSLLKHLSSSMSRLIQGVHKQPGQTNIPVEKTFQRPVVSFVMQRHDLDCLKLAMKQALRKVTCRVFALQAFNWLTRSVSQTMCLHDLFWCFTASLTPPLPEEEEEAEADDKKKADKKETEPDKDTAVCEHPLSDVAIAGQAIRPLQETFHIFLQSVSDVMMYLPPGSALQQMAVRCWCLDFKPSDHLFLHHSHVFSNISKILSKSDEGWGVANMNSDASKITGKVECLKDLTGQIDLKSSSRQAMVASLTDNSTETFWESGDDDRNKTKTFIITCEKNSKAVLVLVHIDNSRDLANKVTSLSFHGNVSSGEMRLIDTVELEGRHSGWICCHLKHKRYSIIRLDLKGPDNTLRVRQIKVLGVVDGVSLAIGKQQNPVVMQQKACEAETLKVFRLLTSEVFGKLISEISGTPEDRDKPAIPIALMGSPGLSESELNDGELDLKEHMVSILFSRSKLTHLQKQVCAHIVQAIRKETIRVQEEWEDQLQNEHPISDSASKSSDAYCFELLSMVLALSGSAVGRNYLAKQHSLLQDMLSLMHTSTPRVQRQVLSLLRRVLPEVPPQILGGLLGVQSLPPEDLSVLCAGSDTQQSDADFDVHKQGILDVFLSCIAKAMTVQVKVKSQGGAKVTPVTYKLLDCLPSNNVSPNRWWLRGNSSSQMADATIALLKDLTSGKLSDVWAAVTKSAIAENILALTKLDESQRQTSECIKTPTLWLALASLCVLEKEHVDKLSSGQWGRGEQNQPRPTCNNHDDGETPAIILCNVCHNLCGDCDRFLHLHRKTRTHTRQVFKEEKEAIKVDLHEGCGRTKLFWVMALADSRTLKAVVEFREGSKGKFAERGGSTSQTGTCRFCGAHSKSGLLAIGNVCAQPECQEFSRMSCTLVLPCGHQCGGIADEDPCLPCLYGCASEDQERLKQDADDMCMICFTEALSAAPAMQLTCGHVFHLHCCRNVLERRWVGPRITFGFSLCPICKTSIDHPVLKDLLDPLRQLYGDVKRKALMRLEYEGLNKVEAIMAEGTHFHKDPAAYAMERYAYYVCYKCNKAYYGGEARCEEQAGGTEDYDPSELVCGGCSDVSRAQMCPKHGADFLEYKCRYCCSVAVFFCFGTTHFCNACHDDFQRVTNVPKTDLPHCPAGPKARQLDGEECPLHIQHPPTGEEFALGCGVCRNAHTF